MADPEMMPFALMPVIAQIVAPAPTITVRRFGERLWRRKRVIMEKPL